MAAIVGLRCGVFGEQRHMHDERAFNLSGATGVLTNAASPAPASFPGRIYARSDARNRTSGGQVETGFYRSAWQ
jgi:hypothetical protein